MMPYDLAGDAIMTSWFTSEMIPTDMWWFTLTMVYYCNLGHYVGHVSSTVSHFVHLPVPTH